jgi:hypothetical protein
MLTYKRNIDGITNQFHSTYPLELMNILGSYWHDPKLFNSPQEEMRAITAARNTRCAQLELLYPESFILSAASHCHRQHLIMLLDFFYPSNGAIDGKVYASLLATYLLLQYMNPELSPLRLATSDNKAACQAVPDMLVHRPLSVRKYWNHRWRDPPMSGDTSCLWDYFLHFAYSRTQDTRLIGII